MKKLIATLQFLTILPLGKSVDFQPVKMISFFPVAGLVIGIILALADQIFLVLWSPNVAALLDVVMLVLITGALHIDGLGDAADGILGHRPREKALLIMKDSRIGVMGLVCILCGLSIKWAGIAGIDAHRSLLLIIIPAYARGGMIFGIKFLKYELKMVGSLNGDRPISSMTTECPAKCPCATVTPSSRFRWHRCQYAI